MNKTKILIIILAVLLILLGVFIGNAIKKINILDDIAKAQSQYAGVTNVHTKIGNKDNYVETYRMNNIVKSINYSSYSGGIKATILLSPTKHIEYAENNSGTKKVMCIFEPESSYDPEEWTMISSEGFTSMLSSNNLFGKIIESTQYKVSTGVVDGKECYILDDIVYIDKSTGFPFKTDVGDGTVSYSTYEFNTVTAKDVAELNSDEYTLLSEDEWDTYEF